MPPLVTWSFYNLLPTALVSVALVLSFNYGLYWVVFRSAWGRRCFSGRRHYEYEHNRGDLLRELRHAVIPEIIIALLIGVMLHSNQVTPFTPFVSVRWNFAWSEVPRIAVECFILFWIYELFYFVLHRAIHLRRLYPSFHSVHHRSVYPTPFTQTSVNVLEAVTFYSFFVGMLVAPLHLVTLLVIATNIKLASLTQHLGHECFPRFVRRLPVLKYLNSTRYHQLHHSHSFKHNYGFQTSVLDRLFGTIDPKYLEYERES